MKLQTTPKLNIHLKKRVKVCLALFGAIIAVLVLIFPFYPNPYNDIYYEAFVKQGIIPQQHHIVLKTPNYVLIGTETEKIAGLRSTIPGFDALQGIDWNAQQAGATVASQQTEQQAGRLIIEKIGVDMPISALANSDAALNIGAWLIPGTSHPDRSSNTVLAGHRYQHVTGPKTLYFLDKVEAGDEIVVYWKGRTYTYEMSGSKIVLPTDLSVLNGTTTPVLTLVTCHPVFSTKERLIVTANLIGVE